MLASETVRHLAKAQNLEIFGSWIHHSIGLISGSSTQKKLSHVWRQLKEWLSTAQDERGLANSLGFGRQIIFTLAWLVCGILLALDAERDGDATSHEIKRRWVLEGQGVPGEFAFSELIYDRFAAPKASEYRDESRVHRDCLIVFGVDLPSDASKGYRVSKI